MALPLPHDPVAALESRAAQQGAQPLLTCYDLADGSRVELSARTFANWVDKTANLIGSLGVEEGAPVGLPLLLSDPGHWVSLVWAMATWQAGGTVVAAGRDELEDVDLAVVGPANPHPLPGIETVACSLHPLGAGLGGAVAGVTDYATVLGEPDVHWRATAPSSWLADDEGHRGSADLAGVQPVAGRLLLTPSGDPWRDLCDLLVAPLLGGGSVVVVRGGDDPAELARIAAQEQALLS